MSRRWIPMGVILAAVAGIVFAWWLFGMIAAG